MLAEMVLRPAPRFATKQYVGILIAALLFLPSVGVAMCIGCTVGFSLPVSRTTNFPGYAQAGAAVYGALIAGVVVAFIYGVVLATVLISPTLRSFRKRQEPAASARECLAEALDDVLPLPDAAGFQAVPGRVMGHLWPDGRSASPLLDI